MQEPRPRGRLGTHKESHTASTKQGDPKMQLHKWIVPLLLVAFFLILVGTGVASAEEHAAAPAGQKKTLWELFRATGVVGIIIVLLSVAGTALSIQNGMELREQNVL